LKEPLNKEISKNKKTLDMFTIDRILEKRTVQSVFKETLDMFKTEKILEKRTVQSAYQSKRRIPRGRLLAS